MKDYSQKPKNIAKPHSPLTQDQKDFGAYVHIGGLFTKYAVDSRDDKLSDEVKLKILKNCINKAIQIARETS